MMEKSMQVSLYIETETWLFVVMVFLRLYADAMRGNDYGVAGNKCYWRQCILMTSIYSVSMD